MDNDFLKMLQSSGFDLLPPQTMTYFKPSEQFLEKFAEYVNGRFVIEVGAGQCKFTEAMHKHGIKALAIEPRPSDETMLRCSNFIFPRPVEKAGKFFQNPGIVIAARPDHSGWFETLPELIHQESELLYAGLERNLDKDIPEDWTLERLFDNVGEEGEHLWRVHYV